MNKTKFSILTTVFIDAAGLGIIVPILPYYVERFSSAPLLVTSLFSVYALCSFFSAPVMGAVSDRVGRKLMFTTSVFSTSLGWFVFAAAPGIPFLFLGRVIDGAAAGNFPIAQAYMTDLARDDRERTTNLGLIGAVFGIAFIVGPLLGGALGSISPTFPFWLVGCLAFLNGVLGIFFLPETRKKLGEAAPISLNPHTKRRESIFSSGKATALRYGAGINPFPPLAKAVKNKVLLPNYSAWFFCGLALAVFQSVFALYVQAAFGFNQFAVGMLFTGIGAIVALNQLVAMKYFWLKYFKEPALELLMLAVFAGGFLLMAFLKLPLFGAGLIAVAFGQSVLRVVMNSQIVAKADAKIKGEVLGITFSATSLSMVVGSLVAGYLFGFDIRAPFVAGALFLCAAFFILYQNRRALAKIYLSKKEIIISEI